ncbi:MAG: CBS domain-containing protein [Caldimicrobium sp.]|jgi:acetoin utilization protein AcuB
MLVKDWMSEHIITLDENTSIMKAIQVLKEHKIRRIPVTRDGKLSGIVTDRDIKEVTPSKITTFEVHELYYLLSELKLKDIMTKDPITVYPDDTVEYAAVLMLENKISGLPVINREGYVVGIITQTDIFKLFVNITGIYYSPYQISLLINHPNELTELFEIFKKLGLSLYSFLTWKEEMAFPIEDDQKELKSEHKRLVFIRPEEINKEKFEILTEELKKKFKVFYAIKEDISKLPQRKISEE